MTGDSVHGPRVGDEVATEVYGRVVEIRDNGDVVVDLSRYYHGAVEVVKTVDEVVVRGRA